MDTFPESSFNFCCLKCHSLLRFCSLAQKVRIVEDIRSCVESSYKVGLDRAGRFLSSRCHPDISWSWCLKPQCALEHCPPKISRISSGQASFRHYEHRVPVSCRRFCWVCEHNPCEPLHWRLRRSNRSKSWRSRLPHNIPVRLRHLVPNWQKSRVLAGQAFSSSWAATSHICINSRESSWKHTKSTVTPALKTELRKKTAGYFPWNTGCSI